MKANIKEISRTKEGVIMISEAMQKIINEQIMKEFYSAYFYLGMKAYFVEQNLDGFANFFDVQVKEERDHAIKFFDYMGHVGGKVELLPIEAPQRDFKSAEYIFQRTYEHELFVTASIYNIVNLAIEEKDHKTNSFLQWFVTEQAEEEATMENVLNKLKRIGNDPQALFMLDAELAKRVYTPPAQNG